MLQLGQSGSTIVGTGEQRIEAGATRKLTVSGARDGTALTLKLTYDSGAVQAMTGTIGGRRIVARPVSADGTPMSSSDVVFRPCT